jgi:hypothetical protein
LVLSLRLQLVNRTDGASPITIMMSKKFIQSHATRYGSPQITIPSAMPPQLSEDEIDDLLYYARTGDLQEFTALSDELCKREYTTLTELLLATKDAHSGNGPMHMAAANGHTGMTTLPQPHHDSPLTPTQKSSPPSSSPSPSPPPKAPFNSPS